MKIASRIEGYNIESLEGLKTGVGVLNKHCDYLEELGKIILNNINVARQSGFDSINCDRAEEIIKEYQKTLNATKSEFIELNDSVQAFIDKINEIWSSW